jgi:hypothetical protein
MAVGRTNAGSQAKPEIYGVVNMVNVTYHPTSKLYVEEPPAGKVFKDIELQKDIYLIPRNIKKGVKIEGVTGTYEGSGSTINTVTMTINAVGSDVTVYFNYLNNGDIDVNEKTLALGESESFEAIKGTMVFFKGNIPSDITSNAQLIGDGVYQIMGNATFTFE